MVLIKMKNKILVINKCIFIINKQINRKQQKWDYWKVIGQIEPNNLDWANNFKIMKANSTKWLIKVGEKGLYFDVHNAKQRIGELTKQ